MYFSGKRCISHLSVLPNPTKKTIVVGVHITQTNAVLQLYIAVFTANLISLRNGSYFVY